MQTFKKKLNINTLFISVLLTVIFLIVIANFMDSDTLDLINSGTADLDLDELLEDTAVMFVGNYIYFPIGISFVAISIIAVIRFGFEDSKHSMAWISFAGFAILWVIGNNVWTLEEMLFEEEPYPSGADLFYLIGYPFLFMFLFQYLFPMRFAITKKMVSVSVIIPIIVVGGMYAYILQDSNVDLKFEDMFHLTYPIADIFVMSPSIIGLILFFRGKTNFMWSMILFGIVLTMIGDILFMYANVYPENLYYYTGHYIEIFFLTSFVFMVFGVYHHIKTLSE